MAFKPVARSPDHRRAVHTSLEERERLLSERETRYTAFSPRPETRRALQKSPTTSTKIKLNHKLRTSREESTIIYPMTSYQAWMDAGRLEPMLPPVADPDYNANVWRHFSSREGLEYDGGAKGVSALVASMYPLCIPPPSRMGDFTYAQFIKYGDIYRNPIVKKKKITWTEKEIAEMKRLDVLSKARVPPTDEKGRIIPPLAFRRLKAQGRIRHLPMTLDNKYPVSDDRGKSLHIPTIEKQSDTVSLASRNTSLRHKGLLWKFSYKLNNPEYSKAKEIQMEKDKWKSQNIKMRELRKQALQQQLLASY